MMFFDSATTSEESDKENDASNDNQKNWSVEERVTQKVQVVAVNSLDDTSSNDQGKAGDLQFRLSVD